MDAARASRLASAESASPGFPHPEICDELERPIRPTQLGQVALDPFGVGGNDASIVEDHGLAVAHQHLGVLHRPGVLMNRAIRAQQKQPNRPTRRGTVRVAHASLLGEHGDGEKDGENEESDGEQRGGKLDDGALDETRRPYVPIGRPFPGT
jgi:hypothetical protein